MIQLERVTKEYGNKIAVRDLSLDVPAGELFAFLGPNGAGKTTTIKMMCGLLFPTAGTVKIGGRDLAREGQKARQVISYVPDQPFLYEKLTGREFLQFIADMYGLERSHGRRRIGEVIGLFQLGEFVDDLTERYSHGMRQRTVFAAALLHEPKVLIVDEPTVGLDPRGVRLLKDLQREEEGGGPRVCTTSHSLDVVEELADRIAIIDRGRLVTCGSLSMLLAQAAVDGTLEEVFLKMTEEEADADSRPAPGPLRYPPEAAARDSAPAPLAVPA